MDFVTIDGKLIVEVDGVTHAEPSELTRDKARSDVLEACGFFIIRISNSDVYDNLEGVLELIEYFNSILKEVDSSLIEEWERMRNPEAANARAAVNLARENEEARVAALKKQLMISIRNELFRGLRFLKSRDYVAAAQCFAADDAESMGTYFEQKMKEFDETHQALLLDPKARSPHFTKITRLSDDRFKLEQTLCDPEDHQDWILILEVTTTLANPKPRFKFIAFE